MTPPEVLVQRQLNAYNKRDLDAFVACFSETVCLRELRDNSLIAEGRAAMRELYRSLFEGSPALHAKLLSRVVEEDVVIDLEEVQGLGEGSQRAVAIYACGNQSIEQVWFA
ncbi:MAG: nuclear transport factor 2 family protein [Myxococcota bacterium]|nr:nuclear transport factor 2 family protein [Myxococcota bacterium]